MRKANRVVSTAFLLGTTALVSPALAQSTGNSVTVTNGDNTVAAITATNSADVNAAVGATPPLDPVSGTIANGVVNSIFSTGIGASATASINQLVQNGSPLDLTQIQGNSILVQNAGAPATNDGAITGTNAGLVAATLGFGSNAVPGIANIGNGVGNSITAQGVGATAGASISSRFDAVVTSAPAGTNSTNNIEGGAITASNNADTASVTVGAVSATLTVNGNTVPTVGTASIVTGVGNSISASAIGASGSASINQSASNSTGMDLTTLPQNTITITGNAPGTDAILAQNPAGLTNSTVSATFTAFGNTAIGNSATTTPAGMANSIGAQAVGASGNAAISSRFYNVDTNGAALDTAGQSAALNTIDLTAGTVTSITATNNAAVTATATIGNVGANGPASTLSIATIYGDLTPGVSAVANSISSAAFGASAGASVTQSVSDGTVSLQTLPLNTVTVGNLVATNGAVGGETATMQVTGGASIANGVANSIAAQGVGASATAGISSRFDGVSTAPTPSVALTANSSNSVTVADISADNGANIQGQLTIGGTAGGDTLEARATIANGMGNSIGASASGAAGGSNITQSVSNGVGTFDVSSLPNNSVSAGNTTATNSSATINTAPSVEASLTVTGVGGATNNAADIANGVGNSISAQAVGASASASISSQVYNSTIQIGTTATPSNQITTLALASTNTGQVVATTTLDRSASIGNGVANVISAQAVGASAGASIGSHYDLAVTAAPVVGAANSTNTINAGPITATDNGVGNVVTPPDAVTATLSLPGTAGTPTEGTATITTGVGNSISASAIGASANASISQSASNSSGIGNGMDLTTLPQNSIVITGDVTALNPDPNALVNPSVLASFSANGNTAIGVANPGGTNAGMANSIGAQGVGAAANAGISSRFYSVDTNGAALANAGVTTATNGVTVTGAVTATNDTSVTANATIGFVGATGAASTISTATIYSDVVGGISAVGNSISAAAFGASAGANITQSVSGGTVDLQTLPVNTVQVTGTVNASNTIINAGTVQASLQVTGNASITDGMANSIAAQGVGASATAGISTRLDGVTGVGTVPPVTKNSSNSVSVGSISADNAAPLIVNLTIGGTATNGDILAANATIPAGMGNSIGASATGAAAGSSITQSVSNGGSFDMEKLPGNTVLVGGTTTATNSTLGATIQANLTVTGAGGIGANIGSGVGNSIAAQAVGASASASISSQFYNTNGTGAFVNATNNQIGTTGNSIGSLTSQNASTTIRATANFGTDGSSTPVSITGGMSNNIGASAIGSTSVASINQSVSFSTTGAMALAGLPNNSINIASTAGSSAISSTNLAASPVTAQANLLGTTGTSIGGGMGNTIGAQAIGAAAGASIMQHINSVHN